MKQLRAFVGHSFDDQDQQLVRSFQDYFDSLKGTIDFEWDHAKRASQESCAKKSKQRWKGRICSSVSLRRRILESPPTSLKQARHQKKMFV